MRIISPLLRELRDLLGGNAEYLTTWTTSKSLGGLPLCCGTILIGCGIYGATFGLWRSPLQSFYSSLKLPAVILLTCGSNALLNGCLAQVLDLGIGFRQSTLAILVSFTITALILVGLSPVMLFLLWNTPSLAASSTTGHSVILLSHVAAIALAGVLGNLRLFEMLLYISQSFNKSCTLLLAWLAGNLLLGTQVSWVLRPFIGDPESAVTFWTPEPMQGNFFEAIWHSVKKLNH